MLFRKSFPLQRESEPYLFLKDGSNALLYLCVVKTALLQRQSIDSVTFECNELWSKMKQNQIREVLINESFICLFIPELTKRWCLSHQYFALV